MLGSNIRKQRELQRLSQERLAFMTGLHRTYIGGIERGERNIGIINLVKIASALNVQPSELLATIPIPFSEEEP